MTGWECPKCGAVWAPFIMACSRCNNAEQPNTSKTVIVARDTCPSCGRSRCEPPFTGCPTGTHYGMSV